MSLAPVHPPQRPLFWSILLLIVVLAGAARIAIIDYSLPYVDHADEPAYYLAALHLRGEYDDRGYYDGVPPGFMWVSAGARALLVSIGYSELSEHVHALRWVSTFMNLATLVVIALTARRAFAGDAGNVAGWAAGALWGAAPLVLVNGINALPDPYVYLCTSLALYWAVLALDTPDRARAYSLACIGAALAGVIFKYPALPALLPGGIAILALLRRDHRRGLSTLLIAVVLTAAVALWLALGYGITFQREGVTVRDQGLSNMLDLGRVHNNLIQTIEPLGTAALILVLLAVIAYLWRRVPKVGWVLLLSASLIIATPWLAASYTYVFPPFARYVLPGTLAVCVVAGVGLGAVINLLPQWRSAAGLAVVALLLLIPLPSVLDIIRERQRPESRVALHRWFNDSLDAGNIVVDPANEKTFNPFWGGMRLSGGRWVDWTISDDLRQRTPADWQALGVIYALVTSEQYQAWRSQPADAEYLDEMLYLRAFADDAMRGPQVIVLRFARPEQSLDVAFGEHIRLTGMDQDGTTQPGETLNFRFYWNAQTVPPTNFSLFLHLLADGDTRPLAQWDSAPGPSARPTLSWDASDETIISAPMSLTLPPDLAPGRYVVRAGLYDYTTGVRERISPSNQDSYALLTFEVPR